MRVPKLKLMHVLLFMLTFLMMIKSPYLQIVVSMSVTICLHMITFFDKLLAARFLDYFFHTAIVF